MKKSMKKWTRKAVSILSVIALTVGAVQVPSQPVEAGLITNMVVGNWGAVVGNLVERPIVYGIGKAANHAENDSISTAFTWVKRIVAGNAANVAADTLKLVKEMSAELDSLYKYEVQSTTDIENMIKGLTTTVDKSNFDATHKIVLGTYNDYTVMVQDFNGLIDAFLEYEENPEDEAALQVLENAYYSVYQTYFSDSADTEKELFTDPLMDGTDGFLVTISPYSPTKAIDDSDDISNPDSWGNPDHTETYLRSLDTYLEDVTQFESNIEEQMAGTAQLADNAAYMYLQAYRYYVEFKCMIIASDASLSES